MIYFEIIDCNYEYDSYKYYKLIFGNVYVKDYIYCNFIKGYGKTMDQANISFIHRNKHWELFFYKVSIGPKFNGDMNQFDLGRLLKIFKSDCEKDTRYESTLKRFYQINKEEIVQQFRTKGKDVTDLIKFFIELNEYSYLEYIYQDYYKDKSHMVGVTVEAYKISNIYEKAITSGNIKMVNTLYKLFKLPINGIEFLFDSKGLYWSLHSSNRDKMVKYLLDDMGYIIQKQYCGHFENYFDYLIKLDHKLFKLVVGEFGTFKFFNSIVKENILNYSKSIESNVIPKDYANYKNGCYVPVKKVIDFIQNSIYSSIIIFKANFKQNDTLNQTISIHKKWLKKIQLLINYNDHLNSNQDSDHLVLIKKQIIQIENEIDNVGNSYFKLVKSFFGFSSPSTQQESEQPLPLPFQNRTTTKFDQFNLDREIKRIYIFDYLSKDYNNFTDKELFLKFIVNFTSYFNEYSLVLQLYSFEKQEKEKQLEETNSTISFLEKKYLSICLRVAAENASSGLLHFALDNFDKTLIDISTIGFIRTIVGYELFKCEHVPIANQIEFLSTMVKLNVNFPIQFQVVLTRILNGNNDYLTIDHLDQIALIIDNYYTVQKDNTSNSKYIHSTIFYHNDKNSNYFKNRKFITHDNITNNNNK